MSVPSLSNASLRAARFGRGPRRDAVRRWPLAPLVAGLAVTAATFGVLTTVVTPYLFADANLILVALIGVAALAPLVYKGLRGQFDIFEPVSVAMGTVLILFVFRPLYDIFALDYTFVRQSTEATYSHALFGALVGVVAFHIGYFCLGASRLAKRLPAPPERIDDLSPFVVACVLGGAVILAIVPLLLVGGQPGGLLSDRSVQQHLDVPPFLLESVFLVIPALFLLWMTRDRYPIFTRLFAVSLFVIFLLVALPGGNRRYLLALFVPVYVLFYMTRERRPRLLPAFIAVLLVTLLVVTPLREARTGGRLLPSVVTSVAHPEASIESLFAIQDTGMVDTFAFAIRYTGAEVPFRHGEEFLVSTLLSPIPRQVWPGKPQRSRNLLIRAQYGLAPSGRCEVQCPTYGLLGDLYTDFGFFSVGIGTALFGFVLALAHQYRRLAPRHPLVLFGYASLLWVSFMAWRAGFSIVPELLVELVGPFVVVGYLASRRLRSGRRVP